jgi:D-glycerate 3-kinase
LEPEDGPSTEIGPPHLAEPPDLACTLLNSLLSLRQRCGTRPALLALNGPVGAGKSTLSRQLIALAESRGLRLAVASIDDFYYPWPERLRRLQGNPFGVSRVPPGSHDLPLLLERLADWRAGGPLRLARFDKGLAGGEGDRADDQVLEAEALLIEGWLMGCRSLGEERLAACRGDQLRDWSLTAQEWAWLPRWDRELAAYEELWHACDGLWVLRPQRWSLPRRWRFQAEARQRRSGRGSLEPGALDQLVRASLHSLPPPLYQDPLVISQRGAVPREDSASSPSSVVPLLGVTVLDGRRRPLPGSAQLSLSSASVAIG